MVKFNELRITSDGKYLIIDVSVRSQPYYENVYLDSISIDTQDTYKDGGPSSSIVYFKKINGSNKDYRLELNVGESIPSLSDNLFFIYIKVKGTPTYNTPCGFDNIYTLGLVLNTCSLYKAIMSYVKEVTSSCVIPQKFIDLYLKFKAFEACINTDHYPLAIEYYKKYLLNINISTNSIIKPCSCNG